MFEGWDGSVVRVGDPAGLAEGVAAVSALPVMADALGDAARAIARADTASTLLVRATDQDLSDRLTELDQLRLGLERVAIPVLIESIARGLPGQQGHSARDWLAIHCPWMSRSEVGDLVTLAEDTTPAHAPVRDAVSTGKLPVRRAARVLRALTRVAPAIEDPDLYTQDVQILLGVATESDYTDTELRQVTDKLIDLALPEQAAEDRARSAHQLRAVNESSLADGTLTRFVITCDAEGAALFRQVMTCPLAAPAPDTHGPDPRTPTQRRYDALITILGRGTAAPAGSPSTAKAKLILTVSYDALTGLLTGSGHTLTGQTEAPRVWWRV